MELIKEIVRVGNSAGVILPREWLNGKARVELIEKPADIQNEVLEILSEYLPSIKGIYLCGSYARGEETEKSDIDIFAVTENISKKINKGKYSIILISSKDLDEILDKNILPILPMIKESKAIINSDLMKKYKETKLTEKNTKLHIESTKSALAVNLESIKIDEDKGRTGDDVAYSLVLRMRGIYIVNCLIKGKLWSNKEFLSIIEKVSGSLTAYEGYLRIKSNLRPREELKIDEAKKLYNYALSEITEQEKWLKKRK